jgi:hypothetical protein
MSAGAGLSGGELRGLDCITRPRRSRAFCTSASIGFGSSLTVRFRHERAQHNGYFIEVTLKSTLPRFLLLALSEQADVDVARAVQDADDLNALGDYPVKNEVRKLDQGAGLGRYIRPGGACFGKLSQYFHAGFEPVVKVVRR